MSMTIKTFLIDNHFDSHWETRAVKLRPFANSSLMPLQFDWNVTSVSVKLASTFSQIARTSHLDWHLIQALLTLIMDHSQFNNGPLFGRMLAWCTFNEGAIGMSLALERAGASTTSMTSRTRTLPMMNDDFPNLPLSTGNRHWPLGTARTQV